jgi:hypothetical protein
MKTMTLTILAALTIGCAAKQAEEPDTFYPEADADSDSDSDSDSDADADADSDSDADADSRDNDHDGFTVGEGDCDDTDDEVYPNAEEVCNGIDDDCDDRIDEGLATTEFFEDYDGDGYGDPAVDIDACEEPDGYTTNNLDCDDTDNDVNPEGDEISWNGIDEDCDGYDFSGEDCVEEALDLTMGWIDAWGEYYDYDDTAGSFLLHSYTFTDKIVDVNPNSTTAEAGADGLTIDVVIETDMTINANLAISGFVLTESCDVTIGPVPVVYTGTVELNVDGDSIGGTVELSHVVVGAISTSFGSGCSVGVLDMVASLYGYDLTSFVDADVELTAQDLGDTIEADLMHWDIPAACDGDDGGSSGGGGSGSSSSDCDDGDVEDCDGDCFPEDYVGDGFCDDGTSIYGNFYCAYFDYDAGDCD